jgi:hypothetical protein
MTDSIIKIQIVATALRDLKAQVVFVGGSVAELYADNPENSDIRPTIDIDCIVNLQISTYLGYSKLEEQLRNLGFQDDTSANAPICRKIYKGIIVDIMPVNPDILGFSNIWYKDGIANKTEVILPDGTSIFILPVEYYLATKLEAMHSRGGKDIRGSHDWEDIVYVLDNCSHLLTNFWQCSDTELVKYLKDNFTNLLNNNNIKEIVFSALPYGAEEEHIAEIMQIMKNISISASNRT